MHAIKSMKNKTITLLLSAVIAVSLLFGAAFAAVSPAHADISDDTKEFAPVALSLTNNSFTNSSGDYPASPTSWTGEYINGGKGNIVNGVIDLSPSAYSTGGNKKYKLDQYDEYKDETEIPTTIFGADTDFGDDEKALIINTVEGARVAYAYKSEEVTLERNSFYRFSVYVKTGNFNGHGGATIKLSGLGQNFAFNNIDTKRKNYNDKGELVLDKSNNYGWTQYSLYVRTSASLSKTVRLVLGLGDAIEGNSEDPEDMPGPASGYVLFDKVEAERISAYTFASETLLFKQLEGRDNVYGRDTALAIDLNETTSLTTKDGKEIGTFSQNTTAWKHNVSYDEHDDTAAFVGKAHSAVYDSEERITDVDSANNIYGLTKNPWAPYGKAEYSTVMDSVSPFFAGDLNANILLISTYDGREFAQSAGGVASPFVTIERFKYYRFSVWVKGDSVSDGDGISVLLKGKLIKNNTPAQNSNLLKTYNNLEGDSADNAHYGWKEQVIYIHGSMLYDYDVSFELWLGSPTSQSSGVAMFDNVTLTQLNYSDYKAMSEADSGNVFDIDDAQDDTNITNGNFINVGDMEEFKFPMTVAEWSYLTPDTVNTNGFSSAEVDTDSAVHGIVPTDADTFDRIAASGALPFPNRPEADDSNVLMLASSAKTAFCYQSPSITIATDKAYRLTVDMQVGRVDGYGASLVLKTTDGDVLSTIENIKNTTGFNTYTFHIAAPLSEQTVYVEIWLGLNDRTDNKQKLSSGYVYVKKAALTEWTAAEDSSLDAEYNALLEQYKLDVANSNTLSNLNYGVYSFTAPTLDYYDVYSYTQNKDYGTLYQWKRTSANGSVAGGVFNTQNRNDLNIYDGFDTKDLSGNMLYIYNTDKNYTKYTYDNSIALVANKYYRIDINVKVRVIDEVRKDDTSIGAGLKLTGSTAAFTNIKDTTTLIDVNNEDSRDYETFKTYSFYIATGSNGGNIGLDITFGGEEKENYIQGRLVIGGIEMTEIDNLDYEAAQKADDDKIIAVELSEAAADNDDNNTEAVSSEIPVWIIPTVILSTLLIIGVLLVVIIRIRDHIKSKRKVTYSTEYDRNDVMSDIEKLRTQTENAANKNKLPEQPQTPDYEESPVDVPDNDDGQPDAEAPADADEEQAPQEQAPEQSDETKKPDDDLDD